MKRLSSARLFLSLFQYLVVLFAVFYDFSKFSIIEIAVVIGLSTIEHFVAFFFCKPEGIRKKNVSVYQIAASIYLPDGQRVTVEISTCLIN